MPKRDIPVDISGLQQAYAGGLAPTEVVDHVFDAIGRTHDPGIFIALAERKAVRRAAARLGAFDATRPLWGVPFAVKDNIDVAGLPTTAACPAFAYIPRRSATAVERLIAAGALVIGKTNLDQFATGLVGVRTPYPVPKNPFDASLVPGGSSSGSAVAVARGLVPIALGTDTAGSGRVPAGLNNIVGLKPSVGAVSGAGVVPACRTLDCVSVFALTVDDAWAAYAAMAGADPADAFSRPLALGCLGPRPPAAVVGVPRAKDLRFFGDREARTAWRAGVEALQSLGARTVDVDLTPFFAAATLLYEGPWVAERYAAIRPFIDKRAKDMHPVTRRIIQGAKAFSAADAFASMYRLAQLTRETEPIWRKLNALAVPTAPMAPSLAEVEADPLGVNARLGTYTNFVNLLDLAAIAVPGPLRRDGLPAGMTLIGPRGSDAALATLARAYHAAAGTTMGATGRPLPPPAPLAAVAPAGYIELGVVGAHLSGMPLNHELRDLGGRFVRAGETEPCYQLYALPGGPPARPGLVRVAAREGSSIALEVWALPPDGFGRFVERIPAPLGIATLLLADGSRPKGFLCETEAIRGARNVSAFGGWRAYVASGPGR
jgi:allophanate hydrolase